ncbi:MAG: protein TonB [Moraxellaceae bacterium]|nr:MAG: protein TonB [Moraxellaceae bacterium]
MLTRLSYAAPIALMITFGLFVLMQSLISSGRYELVDKDLYTSVSFIREKREQNVEVTLQKPIKPPLPQRSPPPAQMTADLPPQISLEAFELPSVAILSTIDIDSGFGVGTGEGDYLPIVRVAPQYPRRALVNSIEGYVIVEFTVTRLGTVSQPHIVAAEPSGVFDQVAISAVLKFRYKPRVVNGEAIAVAGVRNRINFRLAK